MRPALRGLVRLLFTLSVLGCQNDPLSETDYSTPVPGTAYRISKDTPNTDKKLVLDVYTTRSDCRNDTHTEDELAYCLPYASRPRAETHLAFSMRDAASMDEVPLSITADQLTVEMSGQTVPGSNYELFAHDPVPGGQLFVLLIDGSGSMYANDGERIRKVYDALVHEEVIRTFFPPDEENRVMLLRFSDQVTGLDGRAPIMLKNKRQYLAELSDHIMTRGGGKTKMYEAVTHTVERVLRRKDVKDYANSRGTQPVVVLLTDGFNFESSNDACGDNVPRLQRAIDRMRETRDVALPPIINTVGLGQATNLGDGDLEIMDRVSKTALCGQYVNKLIDAPGRSGGLEDLGIDDASLRWLAKEGGGKSFVQDTSEGLATVFRETAALRYHWYQLRLKLPGSSHLHHRQAVPFRLFLKDHLGAPAAMTSVTLYPSGWTDGPPGDVERGSEENWARPAPARRIAVTYLLLATCLLLLTHAGAAAFHVRRAWTRRRAPRTRKSV
jgi:hypothetical protein